MSTRSMIEGAIGGYFGLEHPQDQNCPHPRLNESTLLHSGRSILKSLLMDKGYERVYLPYFFCDYVQESVETYCKKVSYYHINEDLLPILDVTPKKNDVLIAVNFYGVIGRKLRPFLEKSEAKVIYDCTHSFFECLEAPELGSSFSSLRKFFGVPDGAIVFPKIEDNFLEPQELKAEHLYLRDQGKTQEGFKVYQDNELLIDDSLRLASKVTRDIINQLDIQAIGQRRLKNYIKLHDAFKSINNLKVDAAMDFAPYCYPLLLKEGRQLRASLYDKSIYFPKLWPFKEELLKKLNPFEAGLCENLLALPIDHRYNNDDMDKIIKTLRELL
ncbi:MAG: DegT/DnrJ/EryC1/StrS aminotransferase family protein [Bdellovibrionales bacterium]|nr:hypothetical protein [Bdellovibrionales bacterium]NQZ19827.1 DegT/DnrJ/EryC1/StrS aminotransferase family protein [Bdellovibrionales bacterium]